MKFSISTGTLVILALSKSAIARGVYYLSESIVGEGFYDAFNFEAIADPTHGRVNYVDEETARRLNLTCATDNSFVMRADDTTVLTATGPGRNSVRIRTNKSYTTHVAIFDMSHMPQGCGTWPAIWETNEANWPYGGEVDIVEGVNNVEPNQSTLHTGPNCSIPDFEVQLGTTVTTDCYALVNENAGCGVVYYQNNNSFGPDFNNVGGGWYAIERTDCDINVWFWQRDDPFVPWDAVGGFPIIDTDFWGVPYAHFPNTKCDLATHFDANNIIINLTFCGDWAGNSAVYASSGCPSNCTEYVDKNPQAFTDAYFQFNSIKIYLN